MTPNSCPVARQTKYYKDKVIVILAEIESALFGRVGNELPLICQTSSSFFGHLTFTLKPVGNMFRLSHRALALGGSLECSW
ncbi:hypothetical protein EV2_039104 [Malus domestica]